MDISPEVCPLPHSLESISYAEFTWCQKVQEVWSINKMCRKTSIFPTYRKKNPLWNKNLAANIISGLSLWLSTSNHVSSWNLTPLPFIPGFSVLSDQKRDPWGLSGGIVPQFWGWYSTGDGRHGCVCTVVCHTDFKGTWVYKSTSLLFFTVFK